MAHMRGRAKPNHLVVYLNPHSERFIFRVYFYLSFFKEAMNVIRNDFRFFFRKVLEICSGSFIVSQCDF